MLIYNSILAGELLLLLETSKSAISLEELIIRLGKPLHDVQLAVERLVREGLAVIDIDHKVVKLEKVPDYIHERKMHVQQHACV